MLPRLVDAHLRQDVAVVVAGRLVGQDVGHAQQGARGEAALDLHLDLVGQRLQGGGGDLAFYGGSELWLYEYKMVGFGVLVA